MFGKALVNITSSLLLYLMSLHSVPVIPNKEMIPTCYGPNVRYGAFTISEESGVIAKRPLVLITPRVINATQDTRIWVYLNNGVGVPKDETGWTELVRNLPVGYTVAYFYSGSESPGRHAVATEVYEFGTPMDTWKKNLDCLGYVDFPFPYPDELKISQSTRIYQLDSLPFDASYDGRSGNVLPYRQDIALPHQKSSSRF